MKVLQPYFYDHADDHDTYYPDGLGGPHPGPRPEPPHLPHGLPQSPRKCRRCHRTGPGCSGPRPAEKVCQSQHHQNRRPHRPAANHRQARPRRHRRGRSPLGHAHRRLLHPPPRAPAGPPVFRLRQPAQPGQSEKGRFQTRLGTPGRQRPVPAKRVNMARRQRLAAAEASAETGRPRRLPSWQPAGPPCTPLARPGRPPPTPCTAARSIRGPCGRSRRPAPRPS